ncbi:MAG: adenylate/guanylate cyclase domain-containing protein [Hyphomicrobiales bacterium]
MGEEAGPHSVSLTLVDKAAEWLREQAMADAELEPMLNGCFERLFAAGIPLRRAHVVVSILHPLYRALGFTWRRGEGTQVDGYGHFLDGTVPETFQRSPYFFILNHDVEYIRRHLEGPPEENEFSILQDLREIGGTDYLAFSIPITTDKERSLLGSWLTDRPGGFADSEIAALLRMHNRLAMACKMAVQRELANNVLETYLGRGAGQRVLNGLIKRGDGETTRAAIMYGDLRGSTALADREGRQAYIDALNSFFDAAGTAVTEKGGEMLSFMGDGFLAIFPCDRNRRDSIIATQAAFHAAEEAVARMKDVNQERTKAGDEPLGFGLSLHVGNVMFGNVGMADRLAYSVFGATVNEAARLETLTTKYKTPIIASGAFADYQGGAWKLLGIEELKGVQEAIEVMAPAGKPVSKKAKPGRKAKAGAKSKA